MYRPLLPRALWRRSIIPSVTPTFNTYGILPHPYAEAVNPSLVCRPLFFHNSPGGMAESSSSERNKRSRSMSADRASRPSDKRREFRSSSMEIPSHSQQSTESDVEEEEHVEGACHRLLQRRWLKNDHKTRLVNARAGYRFSLMTYNILSQNLINENDYLYVSGDPRNLKWSRRRQRIVSEIDDLSPDIVCLQEVQEDHFEQELYPMFWNLGYEALYKKRTGFKTDGCALLYKRCKFDVEKCELVEFFMNKDQMMNRENVAIVTILRARTKKGLARLCVATSHILFNMKRGDIKLGQVCVLLAEIDKIMGDSPCPLVICGDFNCHPLSPLYNFIVLGELNIDGLMKEHVAGDSQHTRRQSLLPKINLPPPGIDRQCRYDTSNKNGAGESESRDSTSPETSESGSETSEEYLLKHNYKLVSAYTHFTKRSGKYFPEISTHHDRSSTTVDYIFYSVASRGSKSQNGTRRVCDVVEGPLKLLERYDLAVPEEARSIGCLPSKQFGSDHFSLMCKFHLDFEKKQ